MKNEEPKIEVRVELQALVDHVEAQDKAIREAIDSLDSVGLGATPRTFSDAVHIMVGLYKKIQKDIADQLARLDLEVELAPASIIDGVEGLVDQYVSLLKRHQDWVMADPEKGPEPALDEMEEEIERLKVERNRYHKALKRIVICHQYEGAKMGNIARSELGPDAEGCGQCGQCGGKVNERNAVRIRNYDAPNPFCGRECAEAWKPEPAVVDAAGEVLEVGDLVEVACKKDHVEIIQKFRNGQPVCGRGHGLHIRKPGDLTRTEVLSEAQYLPLTRRTLDPDLLGDGATARKARMQYLVYGAFDEWQEFKDDLFTGRKFDADEAGDVLWYATQALAELPTVEPADFAGQKVINTVKKAIVHQREDYIETVAGWLAGLVDFVRDYAEKHGTTLGKIRYQNIRKLMIRFPDGFTYDGGNR